MSRHQSNGWPWKVSCFAGTHTRVMSGVMVRFKPMQVPVLFVCENNSGCMFELRCLTLLPWCI